MKIVAGKILARSAKEPDIKAAGKLAETPWYKQKEISLIPGAVLKFPFLTPM